MLKTLTLSLFLLLAFTIKAENIIIPDANFKQALVNNTEINTNGDTEISESEAALFTGKIYVSAKNISDLSGIEYFINISALWCDKNQISNLNLSKNTAIRSLRCSDNLLTSLNLNSNTAIRLLYCNGNLLTSLDLIRNLAIKHLSCTQNKLTSLNLEKNVSIKELDCSYNRLTSFEINNNTKITKLNCSNNQLTHLDLSRNTSIIKLDCRSNKLKKLDLNKNTLITDLICDNNPISNLNLSNNLKLKSLGCQALQLSRLDVSNAPELKILACASNQLNNLDLSNNTKLISLYCASNQLKSLDISKNKAITELGCAYNHLSSLNLTYTPLLKILNCENNSLSKLNVNNNTSLTRLNCSNNKLNQLNLVKNIELLSLRCKSNSLTNLDISNNKKLIQFNSDNNHYSFSELLKIKNGYPALNYSSNKNIFSEIDELIGYQIDFSAEAVLDGNNTTFNWFNSKSVSDLTNGVFKFDKAGRYYCNMTNASFPGLSLTTNSITIYKANPIDIPDANFKKALVDNPKINLDGNTEITEYEAGVFKDKLLISNKNISDLTGIGYFTNIQTLICHSNKLDSLDTKDNHELKDLDCSRNQLKYLWVKQNTLNKLNCSSNLLDTLDVRTNPLREFNCSYNKLKKIHFSYCNFLDFNCNQNNFLLSELAVIKNSMASLNSSNQIEVFDAKDEFVNFEIDLSTERLLNGKETSFTWTKDYGRNKVDDMSIKLVKPGVYQILKAGVYHCIMRNKALPATSVRTKAFVIRDAPVTNEEHTDPSTQIYPNPVETEVSIKFATEEDRVIRIFNLEGILKLEKKVASKLERFDLSNYKTGMYIMRIETEKDTYTYKFIKT